MKAGRELDKLVAEKVMGWELGNVYIMVDGSKNHASPPKPYSTDIAAAWEVVETSGLLKKAKLFIGSHGKWMISRSEENGGGVLCFSADTAPHAICLAVLKAKGAEV